VKVKVCLISILAVVFFCRPALGQNKEVLNLSLEECILKAMKNNLGVAVELLNPELAKHSITKAKETFLPQFQLEFGNDHQESPPYSWIQGETTITNKMTNYGVSVAQQIPTGGSFSLSLSSYKSDTNESFQLINPRFGSEIRLDFTQPLLKNFGPKVSRREILLAENELEISDNELQSTLLDTIYSVQEAYWGLVYAIENLKVKQQSLQLARDLVAKNKKEVQFGQLAAIEILNAEAVVAEWEADLLQAEALIIRTEEELKVLINIAAEGDARLKKIVPQDKPDFVEVKTSQEEAVKQALDRRPDLKAIQKNIESKDLKLSVARNQMLPSLDLKFSYWSPGIGGDRLIYLNGDVFSGIVVGSEKGAAGNSLGDALKLLYNNWNVGLTLSIPLSSFLTKADFAYAQTDLNQIQIKLKDLEQQVSLDVNDAVRTVETNAKRVGAYRVARELAEKTLDAEVKKLQVGRSTNYFVLDYQDKLANARSNEVKAKIDYLLSVAKLDKATGASLEKRNIKVKS
jgi:outer membrane protein TolC